LSEAEELISSEVVGISALFEVEGISAEFVEEAGEVLTG